eukprot:6199783-Pleurochrysis_carterae.AAC.2
MLCDSPPPSTEQLSTQSETMQKRAKNEEILSGRENGPEKRRRARRDDATGATVSPLRRRTQLEKHVAATERAQ